MIKLGEEEEEKKCYTCHNYHTPTGICQELSESENSGKDPYDTCEEWTKIIPMVN